MAGYCRSSNSRWMMAAIRAVIALAAAMAITLAAFGAVRYWVVGSSHSEEARASDEAALMSVSTGHGCSVLKAVVNGATYFRACLGPFSTKAAADAARDALRSIGWKDAWVLTETIADSEGAAEPGGQADAAAKSRRLIKVGLSWLNTSSFLAGSDTGVQVKGIEAVSGSGIEMNMGQIVQVSSEDGGIRVRSSETDEGVLLESPAMLGSSSGSLWLSDRYRIYKADIEIARRLETGLLSVANVIDVEAYLLSVLPSEIGGNSPLEAYKAQAVVARTEALSSAGRHSDTGWDLCDSTHCQVFKGLYGQSANADIAKAIKTTEGEVLMYAGAMVKTASFHSACGGVTEASEDIWGSKLVHLSNVRDSTTKIQIPDLRDAVVLRKYIAEGDKADLCYNAHGYRWQAKVDRKALDERIKTLVDKGAAVLAGKAASNMPKVTKRTLRGAAVEIAVPYAGNEYIIKGELNIRNLMGGATVAKSGVFIIDEETPGGALKLTGAGYGHGVGMCQEGAKALARLGRGYEYILSFYYKSSSLGKAY